MHIILTFDLPESDTQVIGHRTVHDEDTYGRSLIGYDNRDASRFAPVVKCLEALTAINVWHHKRMALEGKKLKPLYESGVRYVAEPAKAEIWLDTLNLYQQGYGDCEDLACSRAGELQFAGIPAVACIRFKPVTTPMGLVTLIHVMVLHPDGHVEDPSAYLGMKGEF